MMDVLKENEVWTPFRMFATMMDTKSFSEIIPRKRSVSRTSGYITPPLRSPKLAVSSSPWRKITIVALSVMMLLYLCGFTIPGLTNRNKKVVIILAANIGGGTDTLLVKDLTIGVLGVRNSGDWMIEKLSIKNKKDYAARHGNCQSEALAHGSGYELVVKDMTMKRKYAHEWRESWEKVDTIRDAMRQFPQHEWFWWLDLVCFSPPL
jgi:galactosyl transferase GMA12/MNN10 family